jgi:predicted molibdopterin-dependent oxidoreductase YjgC
MFQRLPDTATADDVMVEVDGTTCAARTGDTVASVLLLSGDGPMRRSVVSGAPRAAYCMMGVCFECLVEIDGVPSQQGCLVQVQPGMRIKRQSGRPEIA